MAKVYFKTQKSLSESINEINERIRPINTPAMFTAKRQTVTCACGESEGSVIVDENGKVVEYFILCESCYENAALKQRGE